MKLSLREAFDLTRTFELKLGDRTYTVPPLTFGRFQELLGCDYVAVLAALGGMSTLGASEDLTSTSAADLGARLAAVPVAPMLPLAKAVVPGLDPNDWNRYATVCDVIDLFFWFSRWANHDWEFIAETINFGKPLEDDDDTGPTATQFAGVILSISRALGVTVAEVLDMRLEGFYMSVEAIKAKRDAEEESEKEGSLEQMHATLDGLLPVTKAQPEGVGG